MNISRNWLQEYFDVELPGAERLADALTFHAFEIESIEKRGRDDVLDVKITPNRGHDCLCYRGVAKELSAILNIPLARDPLAGEPYLAPQTHKIDVSIEDPTLCRRYVAALIEGVEVGPSPQWLRERLEAVGQRSINNIVDATNLVMFNMGQPLHAFDARKLKSSGERYALCVRRAFPGEKLSALDGKEYGLSEDMLVIGDGNAKAAIGIAGVKGGMPAAITEATKNIILEAANFDGPSVRKTAQRLRLRTDASSRFEQVISPELAAYGMEAVVKLILEIAGGVLDGYADLYPQRQQVVHISLHTENVADILGDNFGEREITDTFARLNMPAEKQGGTFTVTVPFERLDLAIPEDLVEEVGRLQGYDKVTVRALPPLKRVPAVNASFYAAEAKREELVAQGYSEVMTSVFADVGERIVLNKVDGVRPYLRDNLRDGLQNALKKNMPNKEWLGLKEIKLFEIGTVWKGGSEEIRVAIRSEKQAASETALLPQEAASYPELPLSRAARYRPFSRFPYIVRDVALWVSSTAEEEEVQQAVADAAGALCINITLFDRFQKAGRVSLAFRLIFQSFERTLEDKEANEAMERVHEALRDCGFEIR